MAVRRTVAQRRELAGFIHRLYAMSGETTWVGFARLAGVHWVSLSEWQRGEAVPDGWNLYRLLLAATGGRAGSDAAVWAREEPAPLVLLQELAAAVAAQGDVQRDMFERLGRIERALADPPPAAVRAGSRRRPADV